MQCNPFDLIVEFSPTPYIRTLLFMTVRASAFKLLALQAFIVRQAIFCRFIQLGCNFRWNRFISWLNEFACIGVAVKYPIQQSGKYTW